LMPWASRISARTKLLRSCGQSRKNDVLGVERLPRKQRRHVPRARRPNDKTRASDEVAVRKPAIITTPFPTIYEVAERLGMTRERADELRELAHSIMERQDQDRRRKAKRASQKRATSKGTKR